MTKFYFIRHGKTQWNLERRYQGAGGDSPLLPESITAIHELANYLKDVHFDHAYVSPLPRTRTTARVLINDLGTTIPLTVDDAFKEFNLGKLEGMTFETAAAKYPQECNAFHHHPDQYRTERIGGESFTDVINRVTPRLQTIAREFPTGNILVVTHGGVLCAELGHLLGYSLADLRRRGGLVNTSTSIFETVDKGAHFKCLAFNETSYLRQQIDESDTV